MKMQFLSNVGRCFQVWAFGLLSLLLFLTPALASDKPKHISIIETRSSSLTAILVQQLEKEGLPFQFHLLNSDIAGGPSEFLTQLKTYQKSHSEELIQKSDEDTIQFGESTITWREARQLMVSDFVLIPVWLFTPLKLTGPHSHRDADDTYWALHLESELQLSLPLYRMSHAPDRTHLFKQQWPLVRELKIGNIEKLLAVIAEETGQEIDIDNPEQRPLLLDYLRKQDKFKALASIQSSDLLTPVAQQTLEDTGIENITKGFRQLKTQETAVSAGSEDKGIGLNFALRMGSSSVSLGLDNSMFTPSAELDLEYDIGRHFNFPDFYLTLGGGATLPYQSFVLQSTPLSLLTGISEFGLLKRFYFDRFILGIALRGGLLLGFLSDDFGQIMQPGSMATNMAFGGTGMIEAHYEIIPRLAVGLDLGWRFYPNGSPWLNNFGMPLQIPFGLGSNGPMLNAFIRYGI